MPLYEDLVARALAAHNHARSLAASAERIRNLAATLRAAHAGELLLVHCAWCHRLRVGEEWLELDGIGNGQTRIAERLAERSTHGICPDCFERVDAEAEAGRRGEAPQKPAER